METSANYLGYNTYILGTTKNVVDCLRIILYNKSEAGVDKISLYNITTVFEDVLGGGKCVDLRRENSGTPFEYDSRGDDISGFDVIIYINVSDGSPIGYTEFLNIQGSERNISISLAFELKVSENSEILIINSLSQLIGTSTNQRNFVGSELWEYTGSGKVLDEIKPGKPKYTTHLRNLMSGKSKDSIYLDNGVITPDMRFVRLNISRGIDVNPYKISWSRNQLGYYGKDIVLYSWSGLKYSMYSVTDRNKFGNPLVYTESVVGYHEIPKYSDTSTGQEIIYFSGKYAVLQVGSEYKLFDIFLRKWIEFQDQNFILDQWDVRGKITEVPKILNYGNVFSVLPEITNVYLDLEKHSSRYSIVIVRKIGSWFVLRQKISNTKSILVYTNLTNTIYTADTEDDRPIILNDRVALGRGSADGDDYYIVYSEQFGTWYTEMAREILGSGKLEIDRELGIMICKTASSKEDDAQRSLYTSGRLEIIHRSDNIVDTYLEKYRRNVIQKNPTVPKIIGALGGLVFYIDENYLNYI